MKNKDDVAGWDLGILVGTLASSGVQLYCENRYDASMLTIKKGGVSLRDSTNFGYLYCLKWT